MTKVATDTLFRLQADCKWKMPCIINRTRLEVLNTTYPITKVTAGGRLGAFPQKEQHI